MKMTLVNNKNKKVADGKNPANSKAVSDRKANKTKRLTPCDEAFRGNVTPQCLSHKSAQKPFFKKETLVTKQEQAGKSCQQ